ncbi:MAG: endopeptidase La, partial [Desulfobulbaceae bacterium A2]
METQENKPEQRLDPLTLNIPEILPVLPLHGFVFYPGMGFPLQIGSDSSKQLIDSTLLGDRMLALVSHRKGEEGGQEPTATVDLHRVGVVGYIHKMSKSPEGQYQVLISAIRKVAVLEYTETDPFLRARVREIPMAVAEGKTVEALIYNIRTRFQQLVKDTQLPAELGLTVNALNDPFHIAFLVASQLGLNLEQEQEILEIEPLEDLLHRIARELNNRLETVEMSNEIQQTMKKDIDSKQREFFLRQQLKAIRKELGESDDDNAQIHELRQRVDETILSEEARKVADRELDRMARIPPSSPEYTVSRNYLDWILDLPWQIATEDTLDLDKAQEDLDRDHHGLQKIKKRIIEFLAVRKLKQDLHGPILCLVGPPGVGKTSLGQSIARTMGRKFVRISLGG